MITIEQYFAKMVSLGYQPDEIVQDAAVELLAKVNSMLSDISAQQGLQEASEPKINSGWRSEAYNRTVPGAAIFSKHTTGEAIDLYDPEGRLDDLLFDHQAYLIAHGLYLEHPASTKGWSHVQSVPPHSGKVVFYP